MHFKANNDSLSYKETRIISSSELQQVVHGLAELGRPPGEVPGGGLVRAVGRVGKLDQGLAEGPKNKILTRFTDNEKSLT